MKQNTFLMIGLVFLLLLVGVIVISNKPADELEINQAVKPVVDPKVHIEQPAVKVVEPTQELEKSALDIN